MKHSLTAELCRPKFPAKVLFHFSLPLSFASYGHPTLIELLCSFNGVGFRFLTCVVPCFSTAASRCSATRLTQTPLGGFWRKKELIIVGPPVAMKMFFACLGQKMNAIIFYTFVCAYVPACLFRSFWKVICTSRIMFGCSSPLMSLASYVATIFHSSSICCLDMRANPINFPKRVAVRCLNFH